MPKLNFEVTTDVPAYWLAVDKKDVAMSNGKGSVTVTDGKHILVWWFTGSKGAPLKVVAKVGDKELFNMTSKIPKKSPHGAGRKHFTI